MNPETTTTGTVHQDHSKTLPDTDLWPPPEPVSLPELQAFSVASAKRETTMLADTASRLMAIETATERMAGLVQQVLALAEVRSDKLAKLQEVLIREASEMFSEMRSTMELMQSLIGAMDSHIERLGKVTAALAILDQSYREMVAMWQAEHQR